MLLFYLNVYIVQYSLFYQKLYWFGKEVHHRYDYIGTCFAVKPQKIWSKPFKISLHKNKARKAFPVTLRCKWTKDPISSKVGGHIGAAAAKKK